MKPQIVAAFVLGYMAGLASMYNLVHLRDLKLQYQTWGGCIDANTSQALQAVIQRQGPTIRRQTADFTATNSRLQEKHGQIEQLQARLKHERQRGRREASLALKSPRSSLSIVDARNGSQLVPTTRDVAMLSQTTWADERWSSPVFYRARTRRPAGTAQRHPTSFSQSGQDTTILKIFQGKKSGFFVDLAANDAVFDSNTMILEIERDWQGWSGCHDTSREREKERDTHSGLDTGSKFS